MNESAALARRAVPLSGGAPGSVASWPCHSSLWLFDESRGSGPPGFLLWWEPGSVASWSFFSSRPLLWRDVKGLALARRRGPSGWPPGPLRLGPFHSGFFLRKSPAIGGVHPFEGALGPVTLCPVPWQRL